LVLPLVINPAETTLMTGARGISRAPVVSKCLAEKAS